MCSFEVHYVEVAQKLRKLEGGYNSDFSLWTAPPNLLIFELHQHYVPQKNTFLSVHNDDVAQKLKDWEGPSIS